MKFIFLGKKINCLVLMSLVLTLSKGLAEDERKQPNQGSEKQLKIMDKDKDGKISSNEFHGPEEMFIELDLDKNGYVNLEELESWDKKGMKNGFRGKRKLDPHKLLDRMDANSDNKISKEEFRGRIEMFDKIDKNTDGFITIEELEKMQQNPRNRILDRRGSGSEFRSRKL